MSITERHAEPSTSVPTTTPIAVNNTTYAAQATIIQSGESIQYTLSFTLVNNSTGAIVGYFWWVPSSRCQASRETTGEKSGN